MNLASYSKLSSGVFDPIRAELMMQIGGEAADRVRRRVAGQRPRRSDSSTGASSPSPAAPARCSATAIGERVLGLPREPSFDSNKPFHDVVNDARNWSGRVS